MPRRRTRKPATRIINGKPIIKHEWQLIDAHMAEIKKKFGHRKFIDQLTWRYVEADVDEDDYMSVDIESEIRLQPYPNVCKRLSTKVDWADEISPFHLWRSYKVNSKKGEFRK